MSQQEDDLRALAKIMDFLRAVSIILVVMNVYWFCYEAIRLWGVDIGVVDRILMNFDRTAGLFHSILYTKLFAVLLLALSCLGTKGVKGEKITWGTNLDSPCRWLCVVLPQLVDTGSAAPDRSGDGTVYSYHRHGLCLSFDGRAVDEPPVEAQPHGRCIQQREREFHAGNTAHRK